MICFTDEDTHLSGAVPREGVRPMGRGRAKAKQTKVARQLKYNTGDLDVTKLWVEHRRRSASSADDNDDEARLRPVRRRRRRHLPPRLTPLLSQERRIHPLWPGKRRTHANRWAD